MSIINNSALSNDFIAKTNTTSSLDVSISESKLSRTKGMFSCSYCNSLIDHLLIQREMVTATVLIQHFGCLGSIMPTFKDSGLRPLRHRQSELAKLENVDVVSVVKDYCSFFNYHMLEHIINEFGTSLDQENLAAYRKDFEVYAQCCVIKGPLEVGKMIENGFSNMFVMLDDSFNDCTLSHVYVFVNNNYMKGS